MGDKKYHFIYKITCVLNGKYYIGVHSTSDLEDGYMGSGTILMHALKKHGKDNFKREILFQYPSRTMAFIKERELVDINVASDPESYNIAVGGNGNTRLEIKCAKRFKAENPIFIQDAPEIQTLVEIPFDREYKYIFQLSRHKHLAFNLYKLLNRPKNMPNRMCFDVLVENFIYLLDTITGLYNDKRENKKAIKYSNMLKSFAP